MGILDPVAQDDPRVLIYEGPRPSYPGEAWDLTFAKWEFLASHPGVMDGGRLTCGLCMFYMRHTSCGECPVAMAGHHGCNRTPLYDYAATRLQDQAERELAFLRRLWEDVSGERERRRAIREAELRAGDSDPDHRYRAEIDLFTNVQYEVGFVYEVSHWTGILTVEVWWK